MKVRCKVCGYDEQQTKTESVSPAPVEKEEDQDTMEDEIRHLLNMAIGDAELTKGKPGEQFIRGKINAYKTVLNLFSHNP